MMSHVVMLAVNPLLAIGGQVAAIVICIFIFLFIMIALAFNLLVAFGLSWVREKSNLIKMLRPTIDSLNTATELAKEGVQPSVSENPIVRTVAGIPLQAHAIEGQVDHASERVAHAVIEFRARTIQAQTILKTFFLPGLTKPKRPLQRDETLIFEGPSYQTVPKEETPVVTGIPRREEDYMQPAAISQLKNVPSR